MMRSALRLCLLFIACVLCAAISSPVWAQTVTVYEGARLITGDGSAPIENSAVVVTGNRFTAGGRRGAGAVPNSAAPVGLNGQTGIPRPLDAPFHHCHIKEHATRPP